MIMPQLSSNAIKADWFADDLRQYSDQYSLNVLSVHKHVINFQVDRWPHLLMVAGSALERGPATVGLNQMDFMLLSAAAHEISGGTFEPFKIELAGNDKISTVQWSKDGAVSFAPIRFTGLDLRLLKETAKTYRHMLAEFAVPSASAVLNGLPGGEEYFRNQIAVYYPELVDSLLEAREEDFSASCQKIIGMGRGFSPTGDDLIHGSLVAYHYFSYENSLMEKIAEDLSETAELTNLMGKHMLELGRRGLTTEAIRTFIISIAKNMPEYMAIKRVLDIGSSTGYDLATAILYYIFRMIG